MSVQSKTTLKTYFETGDKPTQQQFEDLIDSLMHISATGTMATLQEAIAGIENTKGITSYLLAQVLLDRIANNLTTASSTKVLSAMQGTLLAPRTYGLNTTHRDSWRSGLGIIRSGTQGIFTINTQPSSSSHPGSGAMWGPISVFYPTISGFNLSAHRLLVNVVPVASGLNLTSTPTSNNQFYCNLMTFTDSWFTCTIQSNLNGHILPSLPLTIYLQYLIIEN